MPLGTKECGTLKGSLVSVKAELETMGNAHAEVASGMRRELEEAVVASSNLMREKRKLVWLLLFLLLTPDSNQYREITTHETSTGTTIAQAEREIRRRLHQNKWLHRPTKHAAGKGTG